MTPTWVEVELDALRKNFQALRRLLPRGVGTLATVKSNAYGHGAVPVACALKKAGADWLGVGTVDEGVELRRGGVGGPILILLGIVEDHLAQLLRYRLTPVVYDRRVIVGLERSLARARRRMKVHLKVDSGMTRVGFLPDEAGRFFGRLKGCRHLIPAGLMTHLADAGDPRFTEKQITQFRKVLKLYRSLFPRPVVAHLANSLAAIDGRLLGTEGEMVRLGIALYGAYPIPRQRRRVTLKPVLSWKTRVTSLKEVPSGTPVSYGRTFRTRRPSKIASLPVGYADGYPRRLSNRSSVLVRGRRARVVGTVCMDMMMIDVTRVPGVREGDEVVLVGSQRNDSIRAEELADLAGTISYEIFCGISPRVRRVLQ